MIIPIRGKVAHILNTREIVINVGTENGVTVGPFARALMPPNWITKYETLSKTEKTKDVLDEKDSYVNVGEPVVQTIEDDEAEGEDANRT